MGGGGLTVVGGKRWKAVGGAIRTAAMTRRARGVRVLIVVSCPGYRILDDKMLREGRLLYTSGYVAKEVELRTGRSVWMHGSWIARLYALRHRTCSRYFPPFPWEESVLWKPNKSFCSA